MKKKIAFMISVLCVFLLVGCGVKKDNEVKKTIEGRMSNAACDSTFIYLSNIKNISFEQAWQASGLSSLSNDYFDVEDTVLVETINE